VDALNPAYSSVAGVLFDKSQTVLIQYPPGLRGAYALPESVAGIGAEAFEYCANLTSLAIGNNVTNIGDAAFEYCTRLASVTIGNSVTNLGAAAFRYCTALTNVYFQGNAPAVGWLAFDSDNKTTVYYFPWTTGWGLTFAGRPTMPQYSVATGSFPVGGGSVSGGGAFGSGSRVTLTAMPNPGYAFLNWTENGVVLSYRNPLSFTLATNRNLVATFATTLPDTIIVAALPGAGGSVSGGGTFKAGISRTVTATANAGYLFANWTENGAVASTAASYVFTLLSDRNLVANFVPNPFPAVSGAYNGLFDDETNGVSQQSCGSFSLTVAAKGAYTGSLQVGGGRYPLIGQFDYLTGAANETVARSNANALTLNLQLDLTNGTDRVTGSVGDGTWMAALAGDRAIYDGATELAPEAGSYTLILAGAYGAANKPAGDSYGTLTVGKNGAISFTGALADGTKATPSAPVSKYGQWPLYASLYGGQGVLWGWLTFTNASGLGGGVSWIKPASAATYYPAGFSLAVEALGARYFPPGRGTDVLGLATSANLTLTLEGGGLPHGITNQISLAANGQVTTLSGPKLALTFTPSTGAFKGTSLVNPTASPVSFGGVLLQNQGFGSGFFLGVSQSGQARLGP
jgi:hypothetical protein